MKSVTRRQRIEWVLANRQPDLTVLFENVTDPHNISAALRSADATGVEEVYIITDAAKKFSKLGKKSSASAAKWLTIHHFTDMRECLAAVRMKYSRVLASSVAGLATPLFSMDFSNSTALLFGNEHEGVKPETIALCDGTFTIPQAGMIQSLNISVACAVTLYEAFRQRTEKKLYPRIDLQQAADHHLFSQWIDK